MNWREQIADFYRCVPELHGLARRPEYSPGVTDEELNIAERSIGAVLPTSLRSLLMETNGVMEIMSIDEGEWFDSIWLVYSIEKMMEANSFHRREYGGRTGQSNVERVVFFADASCDGIMFGFPIQDSEICDTRVVAWYPMGDTVMELARTLEEMLSGWLAGTISV